MILLLLYTFATLLLLLTGVWLLSVWRRDASIIDPFWGLGFVIVAWQAWLRPFYYPLFFPA